MKISQRWKGCRYVLLHFLLFFTWTGFFSIADAADWRTLVQPIGTQNDPYLLDPAVLNALYSAGKGPWDTATSVTNIKTTTPQFFVRFYNPTAAQNSSRQEGSWVMRSSTVRGMNAQQIRDLFALPNTPTMMTLGLTTTGASLYTGIAGPIEGWGSGGGQQSQSYSGPYTTFFNAQPVSNGVLLYQSMAGTPNLYTVGAYLVAHTPEAWSDMESIYNSLDVLYNPASSELFNSALKSISPACFDNLAESGVRAVLMQNQAIDGRIDQLVFHESLPGFWSKALRSYQHYSAEGFDGDVDGVIIGADTKTSTNAFSGISIGWLKGAVTWSDNGGRAAADYYRIAAYSALMLDDAFLQVAVSGGSADGNSVRNIHIGTFYQPSQYSSSTSPLAALSRTANASYKGWNADCSLRGGALMHAGLLRLIPSASMGYLYQSRGGFRETGAGSLDFNVSDAQSQAFHTQAVLRLERVVVLKDQQKITPGISIGWAYEKRIDRQAVTASMNGWSDSFSTYSSQPVQHVLTGSAGVMMNVGKRVIAYADYICQRASGYSSNGLEAGLSLEF